MIAAVILAAGQSKRMGRSKMSLAWGTNTMLGQVIQTLRAALVEDIWVVTGGDQEAVNHIAESWRARTVFNPAYAAGDMLSSLQVGLAALEEHVEAAFVALGDQPQIQTETVERIAHEYARTGAVLIVPSYQMRRGHPWLVARELWN